MFLNVPNYLKSLILTILILAIYINDYLLYLTDIKCVNFKNSCTVTLLWRCTKSLSTSLAIYDLLVILCWMNVKYRNGSFCPLYIILIYLFNAHFVLDITSLMPPLIEENIIFIFCIEKWPCSFSRLKFELGSPANVVMCIFQMIIKWINLNFSIRGNINNINSYLLWEREFAAWKVK